MTSEVSLRWPLRSASDDLNIAKCLGGQYMALEVMGWPLRSASDDLWGQPQMTSILLSARDEKFMAFEVVIWPLRSLYGLGMTSEVGLRWLLRSASYDLWGRPQISSILLSAVTKKLDEIHYMAFEVVIWPLRSLYGLGGQYMALGDLCGRPQMTSEVGLRWPLRSASILLSARDEKFRLISLYGLWGHYMAFEDVIWPWRSIYGLGMTSEVGLRWPLRLASDILNIAKCPWRKD